MPEAVGPSLRDDIPDSYINAFEQDGAAVIHYLVFHWSDGDQYISDHEYSYAPGLYCDKLVTDWGQLDDSVDIAAAVNGTGNPTREFKLSLANTSDTGWWCSRFVDPPENTKVSVYEVVEGQQPILIDIFVLQNLVEYAENELSVSITLVSLNQYSDPYVGPLDPVTNNFYPLVIGGVNGVEGSLYGSHPYAKLDGDVSYGATSILADRDLATAGFASSGTIVIDYDEIAYSGLSGNTFTGCSGVIKSHSSNQYVFVKSHEYLFAFGAGPVDIAGPLYVNGELYTGQYTIYKDLNPVQVGFLDGFPFVRDEGETEDFYYEITEDMIDIYSSYPLEILEDTWYQFWETRGNGFVTGEVSIDMVQLGYEAITSRVVMVGRLRFSSSSGVFGQAKLLYDGNTYTALGGTPVVINRGPFSFDISGNASSFTLQFVAYAGFSPSAGSLVGELQFSPANVSYFEGTRYKQGFPKKVYHDTSSLVIGAVGATSNPADVIEWFLDKMGLAAYVDAATFSVARGWYDIIGFEMVGLINGGKRCSEALKDATRQCRSYLIYDAGKIFLKYRFPISETLPLYLSTVDQRFPKSIKIQRQELVQADITGKKVTGVTNSLAVRYAPSATEGEYGSTYNAVDSDSIAKFGLKDAVFDAYLITDSNYAEDIGDFWISQISFPYTVMSFTAIGTGGMLKLRMGCPVRVFTDWSNIYAFDGNVVKMSRRFGQISPQRRLNEWDITLVGQLKPATTLQVSEEIDISSGLADADMALGRGFGDTPFGCGWPSSIPTPNVAIAWGYNANGELGLGDTTSRYAPAVIDSLNDLVCIASSLGAVWGIGSAGGIRSDGTLWTWGGNNYGQLGFGDTTTRLVPTQVGTDTDWAFLTYGRGFALAIKKDGTLWGWGLNSHGQLGLGDTTNRLSPTQIGVSSGWVTATGGSSSSAFINRRGELWAVGGNSYGELGLGDTSERHSLTRVGVSSNWLSVSKGVFHMLSLNENGELFSCGINTSGELGLGDNLSRSSLVKIGSSSDWLYLAQTDGRHSFAIKTNGTLYGWGGNSNGQLGLGDIVNRSSPVQIGTDTDWYYVSTGGNATLAQKKDGSIFTAGHNNTGQLGIGSITADQPYFGEVTVYGNVMRVQMSGERAFILVNTTP